MKIALCDDSLIFLNELKSLLQSAFSVYNSSIVIDKFISGKELIEEIAKKKVEYDIIFLDIDMPEINGFLVAERLRQLNSKFLLIFTTYMDNEAPRGYHYEAFRFILKKQIDIDVKEAVRAIMIRIDDLVSQNETVRLKCYCEDYYDFVTIKKCDIIFLERKSNRRNYLKTTFGEYELLTYSLAEYKKILGGDNFLIVTRTCIVNLDYVIKSEGDYFGLSDGTQINIGYGKATKAAVRKKLMKYKNERI